MFLPRDSLRAFLKAKFCELGYDFFVEVRCCTYGNYINLGISRFSDSLQIFSEFLSCPVLSCFVALFDFASPSYDDYFSSNFDITSDDIIIDDEGIFIRCICVLIDTRIGFLKLPF